MYNIILDFGFETKFIDFSKFPQTEFPVRWDINEYFQGILMIINVLLLKLELSI